MIDELAGQSRWNERRRPAALPAEAAATAAAICPVRCLNHSFTEVHGRIIIPTAISVPMVWNPEMRERTVRIRKMV